MTKVDDTTEFQGSFTHPNATRPVIHRLYDHNEYIKVKSGLLFKYFYRIVELGFNNIIKIPKQQ